MDCIKAIPAIFRRNNEIRKEIEIMFHSFSTPLIKFDFENVNTMTIETESENGYVNKLTTQKIDKDNFAFVLSKKGFTKETNSTEYYMAVTSNDITFQAKRVDKEELEIIEKQIKYQKTQDGIKRSYKEKIENHSYNNPLVTEKYEINNYTENGLEIKKVLQKKVYNDTLNGKQMVHENKEEYQRFPNAPARILVKKNGQVLLIKTNVTNSIPLLETIEAKQKIKK